MNESDSDRRRQMVRRQVTDWDRWRDPTQLLAEWRSRARVAAQLIPPGAVVLDLGCGNMSLELELPQGCSYIPCDLVARDSRTVVCDFNRDKLPMLSGVTHIALLGVLEYIFDCDRFLKQLTRFRCPIVASYHPVECTANWDRASRGWVNAFSREGLVDLFGCRQYLILKRLTIGCHQELMYIVNPSDRGSTAM